MSRTIDFAEGDPRAHLIHQLRRQIGGWEATSTEDQSLFSSCIAGLDRLLPGGGLRYGMLVEWLSESVRSNTATLSLLAAREACRAGGVLVIIDRRQTFYPPAAATWGIDLERLLIVRPKSARDELWSAAEALRSPAVAAVWAMIDRIDSRAFRRLQLAAEAGRTLGLLLRPAAARSQPSWADVRLVVGRSSAEGRASSASQAGHPHPPLLDFGSRRSTLDHARRAQLRVLHIRGGQGGQEGSRWVNLEIDDAAHIIREIREGLRHDAHPLSVAVELADPAAHSTSARA